MKQKYPEIKHYVMRADHSPLTYQNWFAGFGDGALYSTDLPIKEAADEVAELVKMYQNDGIDESIETANLRLVSPCSKFWVKVNI